MKIVISGASGGIGRALADAFRKRGDEVVALTRPATALGSPLDPSLLPGADLFVHAAYDMSVGSKERNILGTKLWFTQAREAGVKHQLFFSSISAHPDSPSEYGKSKAELENFFLHEKELVVRLGLVVGPGGLFAKLQRMALLLPLVPAPGGNGIRLRLVSLDDVVRLTLDFEKLTPGRLHQAFSPETPTMAELLRGIRRYHGKTAAVLPIPLAPAKIGLRAAGTLSGGLKRLSESFFALDESQNYDCVDDFGKLGLKCRTLKEMLSVHRLVAH